MCINVNNNARKVIVSQLKSVHRAGGYHFVAASGFCNRYVYVYIYIIRGSGFFASRRL